MIYSRNRGKYHGKTYNSKRNLERKSKKTIKIDLSKLSPETRERVKDWDAEDIARFIGWLKKQKGIKINDTEEIE